MEFYQWLLRSTGFKVAQTGYFVYCNGDKAEPAFNGVVRFKVSLIPYKGDDRWIEPELLRARSVLSADTPPNSSESCQQCAYLVDIRSLEL
jgi:hypothetical protein